MNGSDRSGRLPAAAGGLLALASLLVPDDRRDEWLESWQAELLHWSQRRLKSGRGASAAVLTLRALGAFPHAAWERAREFERAASDVRHGARRLLRTPGFTAVSIITLALGIGATAAILSIVHAILLRPLPYDQADDLVVVWHASEALGYDRIRMTKAMFLTIEEDQTVFEQFGAWTGGSVTVTGLAEPENVDIMSVSGGVFPALRLRAEVGRLFQPADMHHEAAITVVLSHGYWERRFGADPSVIGRALTLDGMSVEVIGVLPAGTRFLDRDPDLYLPLRVDPEDAALLSFDFNGLARLKPGIDPETVRTDLSRTLIPSVERYGWTTPERAREFGLTPNVQPLREQVVGNIARTLWVLLGAVALVLLLACVNVANLLLVRAEARRREVAVRKALGAGRNRIARHFAAETVLLGLAGGAAGIGLAYVALNVLLRMAPALLPRTSEIGLSPAVLFATLGSRRGSGSPVRPDLGLRPGGEEPGDGPARGRPQPHFRQVEPPDAQRARQPAGGAGPRAPARFGPDAEIVPRPSLGRSGLRAARGGPHLPAHHSAAPMSRTTTRRSRCSARSSSDWRPSPESRPSVSPPVSRWNTGATATSSTSTDPGSPRVSSRRSTTRRSAPTTSRPWRFRSSPAGRSGGTTSPIDGPWA